MIRLHFDLNRHLYVNEEGTKGIAFAHTYFADVQDRLEFSDDLEQRVIEIAQERFGKDRRKPDAYSLHRLAYFYVLEYIYVTAPYVSFIEKAEEAAK